MSLLSVENLSVRFGAKGKARTQPVADFSFDLQPGEAHGIIGESGSGKSLTALAIMGLLPPSARAKGLVRYADQNLLTLKERHMRRLRGNRIAMVFQEPMSALNPLMTIGAQIAEPMVIHKTARKAERRDLVDWLMMRVGLDPVRVPKTAWPHQLSGGQRQRVMIAMALACEPDILIADEPTTALDATVGHQVLDLLREQVTEAGKALLLITHDLGVVKRTCETVSVMYAGRVMETGTSHEVFRALAHPYTRGLFESLPSAAVPGEKLKVIGGDLPRPYDRPDGCVFAPRCARSTSLCQTAPPLHGVSGHEFACHNPFRSGADGS